MQSIYNYSDPVKFISEYIDLCKTKDESFNLKKWSQEAGFSSSVQLIDILKKRKNITDSALKKVISKIDLDNTELIYLHALVAKLNSKSEEKQVMYDLLLSDLKPSKGEYKAFRSNDIDLFSHYIYMTILSMSELEGFQPTSEYINSKLMESIDSDLIESAIDTLFHHNLLKMNDKGEVVKPYNLISTKTDLKMKEAETYYGMVCDLAKEAIEFSPLDREFQCFSLPIRQDKLRLAKEIIRKCRNSLDALVEDESKDSVYQVNLMMFPLTKLEEKNQKKNDETLII